ncbi:hypothetical protein HYC85_022785 [Camellia sinensis]|uniref:Glutaredoxin domain-containing protein n=1 Tax=Camellia sinensis TaxID=4442 RepID=A0A7J7GGM7_CAMSI|nr:hypothetical protein HYC85_022785 [Camellia sinensis]
MGCSSSKRIDVAIDAYRPPPSSFAVFDINAIKEPWIMMDDTPQEHDEKTTHVPEPILDKLNTLDSDGPKPWDEVSKALEDLKPTLTKPKPKPNFPQAQLSPDPVRPPAHDSPAAAAEKQAMSKSFSFHTLEELDAKLSSKPSELKKTESMRTELKKNERVIKPELKKIDRVKAESRVGFEQPTESGGGYKPVRENIFIVKDRLEREREGKQPLPAKWDPLSEYPEKCPPGGSDSLVLYTTSLGGVRRTYEDCNRVRTILETHRVLFDERDVSLHGGYLKELKEMVGEEEGVPPRLFVKGRYVGGAEEVVSLNETGRLGRMMKWARVERGVVGRQGCVGCGGARFVPCLDCGGSCKVVVGDKRERCSECNENGLVQCPVCL